MTDAELECLKIEFADNLMRVVWADYFEKIGLLAPADDDVVQFFGDLLQALRTYPELVEQLDAGMAAVQTAQRRAERAAAKQAKRAARA